MNSFYIVPHQAFRRCMIHIFLNAKFNQQFWKAVFPETISSLALFDSFFFSLKMLESFFTFYASFMAIPPSHMYLTICSYELLFSHFFEYVFFFGIPVAIIVAWSPSSCSNTESLAFTLVPAYVFVRSFVPKHYLLILSPQNLQHLSPKSLKVLYSLSILNL